MIEVEVKHRVADPADLLRRLADAGVGDLADESHEDTLFAGPGLDGRVLRLRRYDDGRVSLTHKGTKVGTTVKSRKEIEVSVLPGNGVAAERLLRALGYAPSLTYRKQRRSGRVYRSGLFLTVSVDVIGGVGAFAEIEVVVGEKHAAGAAAAVQTLADELGLGEPESRSYPKLVREARK